MSNQLGSTRPWFRLASVSRSPPQEPTPIPEPAPPLSRSVTIRPPFRQAVQAQPPPPTSPADKRTTSKPPTTSPPSSSLPSTPARNLVSTTTVKPSIHNYQIQSPIASPPSPLTPPPSHFKEQSKEGETKEKGHGPRGKKYSSDSDREYVGMRTITITGDNEGAFMKIIQSAPRKNGFRAASPHSLQKNANSSSEAASDRKMKVKSNSSYTRPMNAFINSNVQGINNSIVYNSSCTEHDPGVHLRLLY